MLGAVDLGELDALLGKGGGGLLILGGKSLAVAAPGSVDCATDIMSVKLYRGEWSHPPGAAQLVRALGWTLLTLSKNEIVRANEIVERVLGKGRDGRVTLSKGDRRRRRQNGENLLDLHPCEESGRKKNKHREWKGYQLFICRMLEGEKREEDGNQKARDERGGFAEIVEGRKMALAFGVVGIYFWGGRCSLEQVVELGPIEQVSPLAAARPASRGGFPHTAVDARLGTPGRTGGVPACHTWSSVRSCERAISGRLQCCCICTAADRCDFHLV